MSLSSTHTPLNQKMLLLKQWHVDFCTPSNHGMNGDKPDHCAAMLLSVFDYWHDRKIEQSIKNKELNDIAEANGDRRTQDELLQHYKFDDLEERILGFYSENIIRKSILFLKETGAISIYRNPNPKYHYDRTNFYLFSPEVCNYFIINQNISDFKAERPQNCGMHTSKLRDEEIRETSKLRDRDLKTEVSDLKTEGTIYKTTSKITNLEKKEFYKKKENEIEDEKAAKKTDPVHSFEFTEQHERIANQKGVDLEAQRKMFLAYRQANPMKQSLETGFEYWLKSDKCQAKNENRIFSAKPEKKEVIESSDIEAKFVEAEKNFSNALINSTKKTGSFAEFREAQRIMSNLEGQLKALGYSSEQMNELKNKYMADEKNE